MAQTGNRNSEVERPSYCSVVPKMTQDAIWSSLCREVPSADDTHTHTPNTLTGTLLGQQGAGRGRQAMEIVVSPGSFASTSISTNSIVDALSLDGAAATRIYGLAVSVQLPLPQTVLTSGPQLSSESEHSGGKKKGL